MCACVSMAGDVFSTFAFDVGVEQVCVLAPLFINVFLVAMTVTSIHNSDIIDDVQFIFAMTSAVQPAMTSS